MKWYDRIFGGRKAYQSFWASLLGVMAWLTLPVHERVEVLYYFLGYWLLCAGLHHWFNVAEHKVKNGNGKHES